MRIRNQIFTCDYRISSPGIPLVLSKTATHAVKAMIELAGLPPDGFRGSAAIAEHIGAPPNYLGKLLQALAAAGIVHSQKGLGGGFRLARRASEISLWEIVEPIDHVSRWSGCFMGQSVCSDDAPCPLHDRWACVRDAYLRMLETSTLADLVGQQSKGEGT